MKFFFIVIGALALSACGTPRTALPEGSTCEVSGYDRQVSGEYNDGIRRHRLSIDQMERRRYCRGTLVVREGQFESPDEPQSAPSDFVQGGSLLGDEEVIVQEGDE